MANNVNLDISDELDITCRQGDTFSLGLTVKNSSGTAIDISGYAWYMQIKTIGSSKNPSVLMTGTGNTKNIGGRQLAGTKITTSATSAGLLTVTITSEGMSIFPKGNYEYDIQFNTNGTTPVSGTDTTLLRGRFVVNSDITETNRER